MTARLISFVLWAFVALCVAFWTLKLTDSPRSIPTGMALLAGSSSSKGNLEHLFGSLAVQEEAAPTAPSGLQDRIKLLGTVASPGNPDQAGWATFSVDNGIAKTYQVGATVPALEATLYEVTHKAVVFKSNNGSEWTVELPTPAAAQRGTLPMATNSEASQNSNSVMNPPPTPPVIREIQQIPAPISDGGPITAEPSGVQ